MQSKLVVTGLTLDPKNQSPVVMLRDRRGARELHIRIGVIEASSIAFELEQVRLARPMSHDLLRNTVEALGGRVAQIHIVSLRAHRFAALLVLEQDGRRIELDAKPSDGIALALRARAPIFCASRILDCMAIAVSERCAQGGQKAVPKPRGVKSVRRTTQQCAPGVRPTSTRRARQTSFVESESHAHGVIQLEHLRPEAFGKYKQ